MSSQPEKTGGITKLLKDVTRKNLMEAKAEVDKAHPELAVIRKNIWPRYYDLKRSYGNLMPQQKTMKKLQEREAMKAAWEKDYNLLDKRDMGQWLGSPFGVTGGVSLYGAGCGAAGRTAAEAISSPLLLGRSLV